MRKLIQTFLFTLLLVSPFAIAVYSNLLLGRPLVAYPGVYSSGSGTSSTVYATNKVMTRYEISTRDSVGWLFSTSSSPDCSLTISLPPGTIVRSVLMSMRDNWDPWNIGHIVSVGESVATSKRCYLTNYGEATISTRGSSAWFTCDNLVGSKLFVTNPTQGMVILFEVLAFSQYNVISNATIYPYYSTAAVTGSKQKNLLKTEMKIQTGTTSTCYTSVSDLAPFITINLPAAVDIQTFLAIPQIPQRTLVDNSIMYSSNLIIEVYKQGAQTDLPNQMLELVGTCNSIADPLLDAESDCQKYIGSVIKISRSCPTPPCQLGLCGVGVLSNCDCSKSQIGADYFDSTISQWQTAYTTKAQLISDTDIKTKFQRQGTLVKVDIVKIRSLPDSVSTVCGDILDGIKFCSLNRQFVVLDSQGIEIDLSTSDLFRLDSQTGVLTVQTSNEHYIGVNQFKLTARLSDYPDKGYFPISTTFKVTVTNEEPVILTPNYSTSYTYTIGSKMEPLSYKVNFLVDNFFLVINQQTENLAETYGLVLSYMYQGTDTFIYLFSSYDKDDLAGYVLNIMLTFTLANESFSFEPITVTYIPQLESQPIPCLTSLDASNWEYKLPKGIYSRLHNFKVTFQCAELQDFVMFNQQKMSLYLNNKASVKQPISRSYKSVFILSDSISGNKNYELQLNVYCIQSNYDLNSEKNSSNTKTDQLSSLKATITKITSIGEITIQWNQNMTIYFEQPRFLKSSKINNRFAPSLYLKSLIDVKIIQKSDPEVVPNSQLNFTFAFQQISPMISKIYVKFRNPHYISNGAKKDRIDIHFNFLNVSMQTDLPQQSSPESLQVDTQAIKTSSTSFLRATVIMQLFMGGVLLAVLKFISIQVLIRHMFAPSLIIPANLQNFLTGLLPLLTLDIIPTDQTYEAIFAFSTLTDEPLSDQFDAIGYSQTFSVQNMGFLFIILILTPIYTLFLHILSKGLHFFVIKNRWLLRIQRIIDGQLESMIFNGCIQFFHEECLVFCVISLIQISDLRLKPDFTSTEKFCSSLAILLLASYLLFPIMLLVLYIKRFRSSQPLLDLDDGMTIEEIKYIYGNIRIEKIKSSVYFKSNHDLFMKKFGILIEGIYISRLGKALSISIGFLSIARQIILSIGVIYFRQQPVLLIFLFNITSLLVALIKLHLKPYEDRQKQWIQVFQEISIIFISYSLICFTGFVKPEVAGVVGDWTSVFIIAQMFVFFGLGIRHVLFYARLLYGRYRYRKKQKLKRKTTLREVLQRLAAIHTPNYVQKAKKDKQVLVTQLQVVVEESYNLDQRKSIKSRRNSQSDVKNDETKQEIQSATSNFPNIKNRNNLIVLESYSLSNEIQKIQTIAEQKQRVSDEQIGFDFEQFNKGKKIQLHSGRNPSSVVESEVASVKSVNVSMSSIKFSDRGKHKPNLSLSNDQSILKPFKIIRKRSPSSIASNHSRTKSDQLSSVNLKKSL